MSANPRNSSLFSAATTRKQTNRETKINECEHVTRYKATHNFFNALQSQDTDISRTSERIPCLGGFPSRETSRREGRATRSSSRDDWQKKKGDATRRGESEFRQRGAAFKIAPRRSFTHVRPFQRDPLSEGNHSSAIKSSYVHPPLRPLSRSFLSSFPVPLSLARRIRKPIKLPLTA